MTFFIHIKNIQKYPDFFRKKSIVIKGNLCYFAKKFGLREHLIMFMV